MLLSPVWPEKLQNPSVNDTPRQEHISPPPQVESMKQSNFWGQKLSVVPKQMCAEDDQP